MLAELCSSANTHLMGPLRVNNGPPAPCRGAPTTTKANVNVNHANARGLRAAQRWGWRELQSVTPHNLLLAYAVRGTRYRPSQNQAQTQSSVLTGSPHLATLEAPKESWMSPHRTKRRVRTGRRILCGVVSEASHNVIGSLCSGR